MKNRMNVPEEYEPKLPGKVEEYVAKKKAAAESEGQTIWYQCVDDGNFWAKGGHKSCEQNDTSGLQDVLMNPENAGALMVSYRDNRLFIIHDNAMLPAPRNIIEVNDRAVKDIAEQQEELKKQGRL